VSKGVSSHAQTAWIAGITAGIAAILAAMFFWLSWHARQLVLAGAALCPPQSMQC